MNQIVKLLRWSYNQFKYAKTAAIDGQYAKSAIYLIKGLWAAEFASIITIGIRYPKEGLPDYFNPF